MNQRVQDEHARALAAYLTGQLAGLVREEEKRDLYDLLFDAGKAMLVSYEESADRMAHRLYGPKNN